METHHNSRDLVISFTITFNLVEETVNALNYMGIPVKIESNRGREQ